MGREGVLQEATKKKWHGEGNMGFRDRLATILSPWWFFWFFFLLSSILQTVKYIVCKIKGVVMKF